MTTQKLDVSGKIFIDGKIIQAKFEPKVMSYKEYAVFPKFILD